MVLRILKRVLRVGGFATVLLSRPSWASELYKAWEAIPQALLCSGVKDLREVEEGDYQAKAAAVAKAAENLQTALNELYEEALDRNETSCLSEALQAALQDKEAPVAEILGSLAQAVRDYAELIPKTKEETVVGQALPENSEETEKATAASDGTESALVRGLTALNESLELLNSAYQKATTKSFTQFEDIHRLDRFIHFLTVDHVRLSHLIHTDWNFPSTIQEPLPFQKRFRYLQSADALLGNLTDQLSTLRNRLLSLERQEAQNRIQKALSETDENGHIRLVPTEELKHLENIQQNLDCLVNYLK